MLHLLAGIENLAMLRNIPYSRMMQTIKIGKLKMKRQLIADTLSRVTDPTFRLTTCRTGADMELATL
jgi:hypothetical protein